MLRVACTLDPILNVRYPIEADHPPKSFVEEIYCSSLSRTFLKEISRFHFIMPEEYYCIRTFAFDSYSPPHGGGVRGGKSEGRNHIP